MQYFEEEYFFNYGTDFYLVQQTWFTSIIPSLRSFPGMLFNRFVRISDDGAGSFKILKFGWECINCIMSSPNQQIHRSNLSDFRSKWTEHISKEWMWSNVRKSLKTVNPTINSQNRKTVCQPLLSLLVLHFCSSTDGLWPRKSGIGYIFMPHYLLFPLCEHMKDK